MNEQDVICVHNGILLSHKKSETMPSAATWMDPEIIVLGEVSKKEKDKYHVTSGTYGIKTQHK